MKRLKLIAIVATFVFSISMLLAEAKYTFVRLEKLSEQEVGAKMLTEIYKKIGIEIAIEALPGERAKTLATEGKRDGETLRIFTYGEKNKMMVRIPTPYLDLETTAFAKKDKNITITSKDDLKKYKIVIVRGVQHTKDITEGLENVHVINDLEQMMKFVESGRADIALTNTLAGNCVLKKLKLDSLSKVGTLEKLDLFHYVHEKNKAIVTQVDEVIKKMKESGELQTLREKCEKELMDSIVAE